MWLFAIIRNRGSAKPIWHQKRSICQKLRMLLFERYLSLCILMQNLDSPPGGCPRGLGTRLYIPGALRTPTRISFDPYVHSLQTLFRSLHTVLFTYASIVVIRSFLAHILSCRRFWNEKNLCTSCTTLEPAKRCEFCATLRFVFFHTDAPSLSPTSVPTENPAPQPTSMPNPVPTSGTKCICICDSVLSAPTHQTGVAGGEKDARSAKRWLWNWGVAIHQNFSADTHPRK